MVTAVQSKESTGTPIRKDQWFVLCRKTTIPVRNPQAPPKAASKNSTFSGTRQRPFFAFHLSNPQTAKEMTHIAATQIE